VTWGDLIRRAWRVWRTNRRTFPPECKHCGEFMVPSLRVQYGFAPQGSEWECGDAECRLEEMRRVLGCLNGPPSSVHVLSHK
jgi:hypothetical protein